MQTCPKYFDSRSLPNRLLAMPLPACRGYTGLLPYLTIAVALPPCQPSPCQPPACHTATCAGRFIPPLSGTPPHLTPPLQRIMPDLQYASCLCCHYTATCAGLRFIFHTKGTTQYLIPCHPHTTATTATLATTTMPVGDLQLMRQQLLQVECLSQPASWHRCWAARYACASVCVGGEGVVES